MVYGFDADHLGRHVMVMGMDVLDQLQLGLRRPHHQNFFSAGQGRGDTVVVLGLCARDELARRMHALAWSAPFIAATIHLITVFTGLEK
jgi:hypothetical protein